MSSLQSWFCISAVFVGKEGVGGGWGGEGRGVVPTFPSEAFHNSVCDEDMSRWLSYVIRFGSHLKNMGSINPFLVFPA